MQARLIVDVRNETGEGPLWHHDIPSYNVTCPAFGGAHYTTLYVTTAGGDGRPQSGELAGGLFAIDPSVNGRPEFRSRIGI